MATSPPAPYNTSLPSSSNPKKRPSMSSSISTSGAAAKRPRLSHPLRQTSFPAHDAAAFYASAGPPSARSETGSIAASAISSTSATTKPRGRGRPRKNAQPPTDNGAGSGSGRGGGESRSIVSSQHANYNNQNDDGAGDEDEDEQDAADMAQFTSSHHTETDKQLDAIETQRRDRLKDALNSDQMSRLEKWRAVSFPKRTVQKLVNQIVSQSVTESPINAVRVYGKWFVAEIVERARLVQSEWAASFDTQTRHQMQKERQGKLDALKGGLKIEDEKPDGTKISDYDRRRLVAQIERAKTDVEEYIPNPHRGGLTPDHLREALRRYKADGDGGGVGFEGLSHPLLGIHGSKVWAQGDGAVGKRLFK